MTEHSKVEKVFQILTELNEVEMEEYQKLLQDRIGPEVLSIFESYCRELMPEQENEEVLGTLIHLMITGYLVSANEQRPVFAPNIEIVGD